VVTVQAVANGSTIDVSWSGDDLSAGFAQMF
jgi:hypothetical protein